MVWFWAVDKREGAKDLPRRLKVCTQYLLNEKKLKIKNQKFDTVTIRIFSKTFKSSFCIILKNIIILSKFFKVGILKWLWLLVRPLIISIVSYFVPGGTSMTRSYMSVSTWRRILHVEKTGIYSSTDHQIQGTGGWVKKVTDRKTLETSMTRHMLQLYTTNLMQPSRVFDTA